MNQLQVPNTQNSGKKNSSQNVLAKKKLSPRQHLASPPVIKEKLT